MEGKSGEGEVGIKLDVWFSGETGTDQPLEDVLLIGSAVEISAVGMTRLGS